MVKELVRARERASILKTSCIAAGISMLVSALGTLGFNNLRILLLNSAVGIFIGFLAALSIQLLVRAMHGSGRSRTLPRILVFLIFLIITTIVVTLLSVGTFLIIGLVAGSGLPTISDLQHSLQYALALAFALALILNTYALLSEYLGRHFFSELLVGRYGTPYAEQRAVAFVDLVGSTALAEKLGSARFFELLNHFLGAVEIIAAYSGGSVHKYVGDCAIVTWKLPAAAWHPLDFIRLLRDELAGQQAELIARYGLLPRFTAGLHAGSVLIGELGTARKELGYWGDVMNTTQRIQATCSRASALALISEDYLQAAGPLPAHLSELPLARIADVQLKGKKEHLVLYALN